MPLFKKQQCLLIFFSIYFFFPTCAQQLNPTLQWEANEKMYAYDHSIIQVDNDQSLFALIDYSNTALLGTRALKYDSSGVLQWKKDYPGPYYSNYFTSAVTDYRGNLYMNTRDVYGLPGLKSYATIIKYDPAGNIVWRNEIGKKYNNLSSAWHIATDSSGHVYCAGFTTVVDTFNAPNLMFMLCLDAASGDEIWRTELPGTTLVKGLRLGSNKIQTVDEVFHPDGRFYRINQFDLSGKLLQTNIKNNLTSSYLDIVDISNNWNVVFGSIVNNAYKATLVDVKGDTIWHYALPGNNSDFHVLAVTCDKKGADTYISGAWSNSSQTPTDIITTKFDPDGNVLWQRRYGFASSKDYANRKIMTDDRYLYVTGSIAYDETRWYSVLLIYDKNSGELLSDLKFEKMNIPDIKLLPDGFVLTHSELHTLFDIDFLLRRFKFVESVSTNAPDSGDIELEVYPNPTADMLFIVQAHERPFDRLSLYDSAGRLIKTQIFRQLIAQVDLSGVPPGELVLKVENNGGRVVCKQVLKK